MGAIGATTVLTDRHDAHRVLENLRSSVITNNPVHWRKGAPKHEQVANKAGEKVLPVFLKASVVGFSYGRFNGKILSEEPFDFIVGADLFYDNVEGLCLGCC